jgi:hypothetical protein
MACRAHVEDPETGTNAKVTARGQLVTSPLAFSDTASVTADVINTGYNLWKPLSGKRFVVTDILLYANKNVGATDATVVLYEASADDSTTVDKTILNIEMPKNTSRDLVGLNLILTEGKWLNVKTDDDDIFATVMGYYVSA